MSRVYSVRGSETQVKDMAELVLFYAHAMLTKLHGFHRHHPFLFRVTVPLLFSLHLSALAGDYSSAVSFVRSNFALCDTLRAASLDYSL
jgi:hypothetical protein